MIGKCQNCGEHPATLSEVTGATSYDQDEGLFWCASCVASVVPIRESASND